MAIDIPHSHDSSVFKWALFITVVLVWLTAWLIWRWARSGKAKPDAISSWLPLARLRVVTLLSLVATAVSIYMLSKQPLMPIYAHLLYKVVTR